MAVRLSSVKTRLPPVHICLAGLGGSDGGVIAMDSSGSSSDSCAVGCSLSVVGSWVGPGVQGSSEVVGVKPFLFVGIGILGVSVNFTAYLLSIILSDRPYICSQGYPPNPVLYRLQLGVALYQSIVLYSVFNAFFPPIK